MVSGGRASSDEQATLRLVGRRIRELREARGWAQVDLAAHIDDQVQRAMISDIETARRHPSLRTLLRLADALGVPVVVLFMDPRSNLSDRVAERALAATEDELAPVAKLLDVTAPGSSR